MKETPKELTISVDFDGVIHDQPAGDFKPYIFGSPVKGAIDFLAALILRGYRVIIHTARAEFAGMDRAILDWLVMFNLPKELADKITVTTTKLPSKLYIDDRGFLFKGSFPGIDYIEKFKPWDEEKNA